MVYVHVYEQNREILKKCTPCINIQTTYYCVIRRERVHCLWTTSYSVLIYLT